MLSTYRRLLATRGAVAFELAGLLARLPMSTTSLGIVLLVAGRTGSYGLAGQLAAASTVATAATAPPMARAIDRLGQRAVLLPAFGGYAIGIVGVVVAVESGWPTPIPHLFAVIAGAAYPPVGSSIRARWTFVLSGGSLVQTAFSFEAVIDEIIFMVGPVLVTAASTGITEWAGLVIVLVIAVAGGGWLAGQRGTEPPVRIVEARARGTPLGWTWFAPVVFTCACLGSLFASMEVVTVAFAQEHGHRGLAGVLLAVWSFGSMLAGLATGIVHWRRPVEQRYRAGAVGMFLATIPIPFIGSTALLAGLLFIAGFSISPTLVSIVSLVESRVHPARLTEGMTWISTGINVGVAPGGAIAGHLVDLYGASHAYWVAVVSGFVAAATALATGPRARLAVASTPQQSHPSQT